MGQSFSDADDSESATTLRPPLPEVVVVSRKTFLSHLRNRPFDSWEELVEALPEGAIPQGSSETVVKCDPVDICTWVATFLIQSCIWGLVIYFADQSIAASIVFSGSYGVLLWLCVDQWLPRNMAGKLWPNLPVVVGATGTLCLLLFQHDVSPVGALLCCILPASLATVFWMRKLPDDPDRATLVTNLFLEIWAVIIAVRLIVCGEDSLSTSSYFDFGSLTSLGAIAAFLAVLLHRSPGPWTSVELVTWTLNVGILGLGVGTTGLLVTFAWEHPEMELLAWIPFSVITGLTGLLGFRLQRSFPLLMSALGLAALSIRGSMFVGDSTGSPVAGVCTFGLLGFAVIALAQTLDRSSLVFSAKGRQVCEQNR